MLWLRSVLVLELLLGARVEYRNEHVGDYVKDAFIRYNTTSIIKRTLFSDEW